MMKDVLIIVPEGGMLFEAAGVVDILQRANHFVVSENLEPHYSITVATTQKHHVIHGQSNLKLLADKRLCDLKPEYKRHSVIVTGRGLSTEENTEVAEWISLSKPYNNRIVSICGGALILAEAGILDGLIATTHWRLVHELQSRFPSVKVENAPIFVQDQNIWTSAGVSAGFDLTLALVEEDLGFEIARDIAQDLVMFLRRPGNQSQFSRSLISQAPKSSRINNIHHWILNNLAGDLSISALSDRFSMSPRNFTRVFTKESGLSPAKYVEEARLEDARRRLEQSSLTLKQVAHEAGFGSTTNLRRVFERHLEVTPEEYRNRFSSRYLS
ncbi:GlxA family transcriptional regulator [Vibrio sp. Y2-5]|uniref:GlxA family transcriptional regulator n=1 Tax=Vibrio sp. Y2-5 TaxID=2743977 RepID=UPI001CB6F6BE|nr:helix-turn-helix domain-containing protein [Vibrio sp. Y2-5]